MPKNTSVQSDLEGRIEKIRAALKDRTLSKVAEATNLHVNTIRSIAKKSDKTFSVTTVDTLYNYLFGVRA